MTLENRTAVITGATGGLGPLLAGDLAALGANLVLLGRDAAALEALAARLALPAEQVLLRAVDLLDPAAARAAADEAVARFGRLDILLHLVGGWTGGKTLLETPAEDVESMLGQHVRTTFHAVQAFVPHLVRGGWGRVIAVSSPYAARPGAKGGPYAAAKAAQEALLLTLSQELKGSGVTVNLLLAKTIDLKREKVSAPSRDNASWTTPEELSAAVRYLLSEEGGALNGARLPLFGSYG